MTIETKYSPEDKVFFIGTEGTVIESSVEKVRIEADALFTRIVYVVTATQTLGENSIFGTREANYILPQERLFTSKQELIDNL